MEINPKFINDIVNAIKMMPYAFAFILISHGIIYFMIYYADHCIPRKKRNNKDK